jgi:hypothetical protein
MRPEPEPALYGAIWRDTARYEAIRGREGAQWSPRFLWTFPPCPIAVHPSFALYDALTRPAVRT